MSKESRTKVPDVSRVVNAVTGKEQELSSARGSGWYRVKYRNGKWSMAFWIDENECVWGKGHWSDGGEIFSDETYAEINETPVNPVPADDGCIYYAVEEHDEDMNHGVGGWQVLADEFNGYSEASEWLCNYEDYESDKDRFRITWNSLETRVVKEGES